MTPTGAPTYAEALRYGAETLHMLAKILKQKGHSTSVGDEGGFAPNLKSSEEACEVIVEAIAAAGYQPGRDIALALDPAASSFFHHGGYDLGKSGAGRKTGDEMIDLYRKWLDAYPIISIEDGLDENGWQDFTKMTLALGDRSQIVGDDIFVTNPAFVRRGITTKAANAALIKLNQIGTVTETIETHRPLPRRWMALHHLASIRRDRGHVHGRFRRDNGRRTDQDRLRLPQRAGREIQQIA